MDTSRDFENIATRLEGREIEVLLGHGVLRVRILRVAAPSPLRLDLFVRPLSGPRRLRTNVFHLRVDEPLWLCMTHEERAGRLLSMSETWQRVRVTYVEAPCPECGAVVENRYCCDCGLPVHLTGGDECPPGEHRGVEPGRAYCGSCGDLVGRDERPGTTERFDRLDGYRGDANQPHG